MKHIVALLFAFFLFVPTVLADTDFSNMSLEELMKLQQEMEAAIKQRQSENSTNSLLEKLILTSVGDYITFGTYEQDNKSSNGSEEIYWKVLAKENDKLLVISSRVLDAKIFNVQSSGNTWDTSYIRSWLNEVFFHVAFTAEEQALIPTVTVSADRNPESKQSPGKTTQDKVFLLSLQEVNKYMPTLASRSCKDTTYADEQGTLGGNVSWWLRSPGSSKYDVAYISGEGNIKSGGTTYWFTFIGVRPAMWIDLAP